MKKIALSLFAIIAFGLIGCGSNDTTSSDGATEDSSAEGNDVKEINIAHSTNDSDISHYQQYALKFKEIVEEQSDGSIKVIIHPNGTLGGERELTEGVQIGTIDSAIVSSAPVGNFSELIELIEFPFLFEDGDHVFEVLNGEIGQEINDDIYANGIQVLSWLEVGFGYYSNNVRPIISPADLKGMSLRTVENEVKIAMEKDFGAEPTPMAFTEVYTALQQGVVDGQSNPMSTIVPNGFHEVQKYLSQTEHYFQSSLFIINPNKFDSFSEEEQKIITDAAQKSQEFEREFIDELTQEFIQIAEDEGVEITYNDEIDVEAFEEATEDLYSKYEDEFGEFHQRIRDLR